MSAPAWVWHDVEHSGYEADLPLWRELADEAGGPVLDLGAGTGRVAIDLAASGHEVTALDLDPELLATLTKRAPHVMTVTADARDFDLATSFALVIAPMQLVQIAGGPAGRAALLERAHAHLSPGGRFAAALADAREAEPAGSSPPLPDMLELDGWLFSSQPVSVSERNRCVVVTRRREGVSPQGERNEEMVEIGLDLLTAEEFERELLEAGFTEPERRAVPDTADHIGSTVVLCRR